MIHWTQKNVQSMIYNDQYMDSIVSKVTFHWSFDDVPDMAPFRPAMSCRGCDPPNHWHHARREAATQGAATRDGTRRNQGGIMVNNQGNHLLLWHCLG